MAESLVVPSSEELAEGLARWDEHQSREHTLIVKHQAEKEYLFFCAECSCGEKFVVNCIER